MREDKTVPPLFERYADSAPGPFYVIKGQCMICALPPEVAPHTITWSDETFRLDNCVECPTHCRIKRQPETDDEIDSAIEAASASCTDAIRYCGTDPKILAKFRKYGDERLCDAVVQGLAEQGGGGNRPPAP